MSDEQKLQIAIYKINTESLLIVGDEKPLDSLSAKIRAKDIKFHIQKLNEKIVENFELRLFYKRSPSYPKWKKFFQSSVEYDQDILKQNQGHIESFVLICFNSKSGNLFAVTGGQGYHAIEEFIYDDFGVDVLSRVIKREDKILKSVKEKSFIGGILGSTKYFRNNYNFFENDNFGKIYQELKTILDKKVLTEHFGFTDDDFKGESTCIAKTSFKINKSISLEQLIEILKGCEFVLENLTSVPINSVEKIEKTKNQRIVEGLEGELLSQLWERYQRGTDYSIDFDLCHYEFEKYLTASKYQVKNNLSEKNFFGDFDFLKLGNIDLLFAQIKTMEDKPDNKESFIELMQALKIYTYSEEDENHEMTKGTILSHIFGDVSFESKKYFLIDNKWYKIKDEFIKELNDSCKFFIKQNFNSNLTKKWNYPANDEDTYNQGYIGEKDTIVLHKILPENIEPCDILKWDENNLYFFHIKAGFGNTMRDLCSQIFIAATRVKNDINASGEYIGKIYDQLKNKAASEDPYFKKIAAQTNNTSREAFIKLFSTKKIVFVLALFDTASQERNIQENIEKFSSNIAKFSLQELVKVLKGIDVNFEISQIFKPT